MLSLPKKASQYGSTFTKRPAFYNWWWRYCRSLFIKNSSTCASRTNSGWRHGAASTLDPGVISAPLSLMDSTPLITIAYLTKRSNDLYVHDVCQAAPSASEPQNHVEMLLLECSTKLQPQLTHSRLATHTTCIKTCFNKGVSLRWILLVSIQILINIINWSRSHSANK